MRILVLSDSHGDSWGVREILAFQPTARAVCFLGDGWREAETHSETNPLREFHMVRGNCDWGSNMPTERLIELDKVRILMTHGHTYNVKFTDSELLARARSMGAQIVLYGHTHKQRADYEDGLHIVNPGSCQGSRGTFAVIDITKAGIVPILLDRDKITL